MSFSQTTNMRSKDGDAKLCPRLTTSSLHPSLKSMRIEKTRPPLERAAKQVVPQIKTGPSEGRRCSELPRVREMTQGSTYQTPVRQSHRAQGKGESGGRKVCAAAGRERPSRR